MSATNDQKYLFSDSEDEEYQSIATKKKVKVTKPKKNKKLSKAKMKTNTMTRVIDNDDDDDNKYSFSDDDVAEYSEPMVKAKLSKIKTAQAKAKQTTKVKPKVPVKAKKKGPSASSKEEPKEPSYRYIELKETFDADKLNFICQNFKKFKTQLRWRDRYDEIDPLKIITAYLKRSRHGTIRVNYKQKRGVGRFFAVKSMSLQNIPREIRHTIAREFYIDIDLVNCHPVILSFLSHSNDFKCENLDYYIANREEVLKTVMIDGKPASRDAAKQLFLSIMNGGYQAYSKISPSNKFVDAFKEEIGTLHSQFRKLHKVRYDIHKAARIKKGSDFNHRGSFINTLFCDFENKILQCMYEYFGKPEDAVLCFDGIMLRNTQEYDIDGCMAHIQESLGIDIKLKKKTMDEHLDLNKFTIKPYKYFDLKYFSDFDIMLDNALIHEHPCGNIDKFVYPEWCEEWVNNSISLLKRGGEQIFLTLNSDVDMLTKEVKVFHTLVNKKNLMSTLNVTCNVKNYKYTHKGSNEPLTLFHILGPTIGRKGGFLEHCISERKLPIFKNLMFYPFLKRKGIPDTFGKLNLFTGYPLEEIKKVKTINFEDSLLYKHLKEEFFNNDFGEFIHFLDHVSDLIQCPNKVRGTAHLFYSKQGTGKGLLSDFMRGLIGQSNHVIIKDFNRYMEKFNSAYSNKLLKVFEELPEKGGAFTKSDKLKSQIDQKTENVEPKGFKAYEIAHFARFWFFTNNENTLYIEGCDRRYTLHKINGRYANNKEYFAPMWAEIENEQFLKNAFEYFATREYDVMNAMKTYDTQYKKEQKEANLPKAVKFIVEHITKTYGEAKNEDLNIKVAVISTLYKAWCDDGYGKYHKGAMLTQLGRIDMKPKRISHNGSRAMRFSFNLMNIQNSIRDYLKDDSFTFKFSDIE